MNALYFYGGLLAGAIIGWFLCALMTMAKMAEQGKPGDETDPSDLSI